MTAFPAAAVLAEGVARVSPDPTAGVWLVALLFAGFAFVFLAVVGAETLGLCGGWQAPTLLAVGAIGISGVLATFAAADQMNADAHATADAATVRAVERHYDITITGDLPESKGAKVPLPITVGIGGERGTVEVIYRDRHVLIIGVDKLRREVERASKVQVDGAGGQGPDAPRTPDLFARAGDYLFGDGSPLASLRGPDQSGDDTP